MRQRLIRNNLIVITKAVIIFSLLSIFSHNRCFCFGEAINKNQYYLTLEDTTISVTCFASDSINLYASIYSVGLIKSSDNGQSWKTINSGQDSSKLIMGIKVKNNILFLWKNIPGLMISLDSGISWSSINFFNNIKINDIIILDKKILLSSNKGLYSSYDSGFNWEFDNSLLDTNIQDFYYFQNIIYALTSNNLYFSSNHCISWNIIDTKNININPYSFTVNNAGIYLLDNDDKIFLSTNYGSEWLSKSNNLKKIGINVIYSFSDRIYIGSDWGIFYTLDFGDNWFRANINYRNPRIVLFTEFLGDLFAGSVIMGIFKSNDGGFNFKQINKGIPNKKY